MSKGGGGSTKNYFGTIAGAVCAGPVDELVALLIDGATLWPTTKHWADGIVDFPVWRYRRYLQSMGRRAPDFKAAQLEFAKPHTVKQNQKFLLTGMPDESFNCATPTAAWATTDHKLVYANEGDLVAWTDGGTGRLTKVVHYQAGDLVAYAGGIWICAVEHDGTPDKAPPNATYWEEVTVKRAESDNPYVFTVEGLGTAYFYWGTEDQNLDTVSEQVLAANDHPPYRRQAVLVLKDFLFGMERSTAPNVELVLRRRPVQTVVAGEAAELDDDYQANPLAVQAELLTDPVFGAGLAGAALDGPSWQVAADDLATAHDRTYISPVLDRATGLRALISELVAYYDGWFRYNANGVIEAGRFLHGEAPPAFTAATTIDEHDLVDEIAWDAQGWSKTSNETVVKFENMERAYKSAGMLWVSGYNREVVGEPRRNTIDRTFIKRRLQAAAQAAEYGKIAAQPNLGGSLVVKAEKASGILPGSLFLLAHSKLAISVVCRCVSKRWSAPPAGRATLRFESERGIAPLPYGPAPAIPEMPKMAPAANLLSYQLVQPPALLTKTNNFSLVVLAARTSGVSVGVRPWMQVDDESGFYQLGEQRGWAVWGMLSEDYAAPASKATAERGRASGVATLKATGHGYASGMHVAVSGMGGTGYDTDDAIITVTDADHFTYENSGDDESMAADVGGTVTPTPDDESETLQLSLSEFSVPGDIEGISDTQTEDAISDNALLVWLFDAIDPKKFELCTVRAIRLDDGVYKLKVRRGRYGMVSRSFAQGDDAWIMWRRDLVSYTHAAFARYAAEASTAKLRLQLFTARDETDLTDEDLCPDVAYTFGDTHAPAAAWINLQKNGADIADLSVTFLPTDVFGFSFEITDAGADLVSASLVARLASVETLLWSGTFAQCARQMRSASFSLATAGTYRIFCVAGDAAGRVTETELCPVGGGSTATITIQAAGSSMVLEPYSSPTPGGKPYRTGNIVLSCGTAGATIYFQVKEYGVAPGATWNTYSGMFPLTFGDGKTVYMYATHEGMTNSPVGRADYWYIGD
jgi:hypothetical protein